MLIIAEIFLARDTLQEHYIIRVAYGMAILCMSLAACLSCKTTKHIKISNHLFCHYWSARHTYVRSRNKRCWTFITELLIF